MISNEQLHELLTDVFGPKVNILKEIQAGLRCKTFVIEKNNIKYIFQIYKENTKYQAQKKYDILKLFNDEKIPKVYIWGIIDEYAYLVTDYKEGEELTKFLTNIENSSYKTLDSLARILAKIHSVKGDKYGWITDTGIIGYTSFYEYITSEFDRLSKNIMDLDKNLRNNILKKVIRSMDIIYNSKVESPNLCWYDLNPDNILIKNSDISAIIDPGGARYGVAEWDLAFVKMEVCRNEIEFEAFINSYLKYSKRTINKPLLLALTTMVEFDDIAIRVNDKIKLPIPYATIFRNEIEIIERNF